MAEIRKLIAGNWKMNNLAAEGQALASAIADYVATAKPPNCDLLVCPPATILQTVAEQLSGSAVAVGGQNCHAEPRGAYTGEISATMLADVGATYVILGHSERRHGMGETDAMVQAKVTAAQGAGLVAIICIGETDAERDSGQTLEVLSRQIDSSLPSQSATLTGANTVVAYEPVWAIGTGRTPKNDEIAIAQDHIRACLLVRVGAAADQIRLLYGGSMKPDNAAAILAIDNVEGGLIGGASLASNDFCAIATAAVS